ncbi:MAG: hypothetical protein ABIG42_03740 [bacterium]
MSDADVKKDTEKCPMCGGFETEDINTNENSYGEFCKVHLCRDCDIEFEIKKQY